MIKKKKVLHFEIREKNQSIKIKDGEKQSSFHLKLVILLAFLRFVLCIVWSVGLQHHQGACWKFRISGPTTLGIPIKKKKKKDSQII